MGCCVRKSYGTAPKWASSAFMVVCSHIIGWYTATYIMMVDGDTFYGSLCRIHDLTTAYTKHWTYMRCRIIIHVYYVQLSRFLWVQSRVARQPPLASCLICWTIFFVPITFSYFKPIQNRILDICRECLQYTNKMVYTRQTISSRFYLKTGNWNYFVNQKLNLFLPNLPHRVIWYHKFNRSWLIGQEMFFGIAYPWYWDFSFHRLF